MKIYIIFIILLCGVSLGLNAYIWTSPHFSANPERICFECKDPLGTTSFLKLGEQYYHPYHLYCESCSLRIRTGYELEGEKPYHPICLKQKNKVLCSLCKKSLTLPYREREQSFFHESCFEDLEKTLCEHCHHPLEGSYWKYDQKAYHLACFRDHIALRCDVCEEPMLEEYSRNYWNAFHQKHRDLPQCSICSRCICQAITSGGTVYPDKRHICRLCETTAVTTSDQIQACLEELRPQLLTFGLPLKTKELPIELVWSNELQEKAKFWATPNIQGLTVSETRTQGEIRDVRFKIYILNGLEKTFFKSVLVHELVHVWVKENTDRLVERPLEEGFAHFISALWLKTQKTKLSDYLLYQLQINPDPIYGEGLRRVTKAVEETSQAEVMRKILHQGKF
jgi:hypothetical protein